MAQKIYISGPMSGRKNLNFDAFDYAEQFLKEGGWTVVSPAQLSRITNGWEKYPPEADQTAALTKEERWHIMQLDMAALADCDAIFLLHGWEHSPGAIAEVALSEFLGIDKHFAEDSYMDESEAEIVERKNDRSLVALLDEEDWTAATVLLNEHYRDNVADAFSIIAYAEPSGVNFQYHSALGWTFTVK